jgi:hypothetical protein
MNMSRAHSKTPDKPITVTPSDAQFHVVCNGLVPCPLNCFTGIGADVSVSTPHQNRVIGINCHLIGYIFYVNQEISSLSIQLRPLGYIEF